MTQLTSCRKGKTNVRIMRRGENRATRKVIRTTVGELVVAVTDEVMPIIRDPSDLYMVVSFILADLLAHDAVCVYQRSRLKLRKSFCEELARTKMR
jgi:hypothetical protein